MKKKMMPKVLVMLILLLAGVYYAAQGVLMHEEVKVEEAKFHALQDEYFSQSKVTRDGAATNSELSKKLVQIQQYPSILLELKLVGVGKILTGIFIVLFCILIALVIMPTRLKEAIEASK